MIRKCERCGNPMDLFACELRLGPLPELRSYRCPCCRNVETDVGTIIITPMRDTLPDLADEHDQRSRILLCDMDVG
jgi:hypothetical protein